MDTPEENFELTIDDPSSIQTKSNRQKKDLNAKTNQKADQIHDDLDGLIKVLEAKGFDDFIQYLRSPWRIMWANFLAGIFKGLGILIGMTLVLGILVTILSQFVNFPLIGEYFAMFTGYLKSIPQPNVY